MTVQVPSDRAGDRSGNLSENDRKIGRCSLDRDFIDGKDEGP
jgi:hypothetical protein